MARKGPRGIHKRKTSSLSRVKKALRKTRSSKARKPSRAKTTAKRAMASYVLAGAGQRAAGFDCGSYPGDAAIKAWAANSPYEFVGFYFDAPCHSPSTFKTWSGKSGFITSTGLGLAVIYVGFQQEGCGSTQLSRDMGITHGQDTVAKFTIEGFKTGTIVFLDVESFDGPLSSDMEAYIRGWISALLDDGTVGPGIYCPKSKANDILVAAQNEYAAHGLPNGQPKFWIVKVDALFDPATSTPDQSGVSFANMWQGRLDITETHGGVTIDIDQDVADSSNPSGAKTKRPAHAAIAT